MKSTAMVTCAETDWFGVVALRAPARVGVQKLIDHFGTNLAEAKIIPWGELENVIGFERNRSRFQTVFRAWRKLLLERWNIVLAPLTERRGFIVATPQKRIDVAASYVERGRRSFAKGLYIAYGTDPDRLAEGDRARRESILGLRTTNDAMLRLAAVMAAKPLPMGE